MAPALAGVAPADAATPRSFYYAKLWQHWSSRQRTVALGLAAARSTGAVRDLLNGDRGALAARWTGFSPALRREIEQRRRADACLSAFLDQEERKGLHALLNPVAVPFDRNVLKNKASFEARCEEAALPVPRSLWAGLDEAEALIVKPQYGSKGKGVRRFDRQAAGDWQEAGGPWRVAAADFAGWIDRMTARGQIVQECLAVDPSLADISPGALPTLRVVTCRNEVGAPEVTDVALRLSLSAGAVDNFNADNLVCGVDARGFAGPALRRLDGRLVECARHPLTDATIERRRLALYGEATALAVRAHDRLGDGFTVIGWDIGLTARGAVLVEGNWNPGYNVMQLVHGRGLGDTRLGALYRRHLEHLDDRAWAAAAPITLAQSPFRRTRPAR